MGSTKRRFGNALYDAAFGLTASEVMARQQQANHTLDALRYQLQAQQNARLDQMALSSGPGQWLFSGGTSTNTTTTTGTSGTYLKFANEPDPRMSPGEDRRRRSGVWQCHKSFETGQIEWVLDKDKLHEALHHLFRDSREHERFMRDPELLIDSYFGEGTYRAMRSDRDERWRFWDDHHRTYNNLPPSTPVRKKKEIDIKIPKLSARPKGFEPFEKAEGLTLVQSLQQQFDWWTKGITTIGGDKLVLFGETKVVFT